MKKSDHEIEILDFRKTISWYRHIVLYLLNRTSGIPEAITQLINEANNERIRKYGFIPEKKKAAK